MKNALSLLVVMLCLGMLSAQTTHWGPDQNFQNNMTVLGVVLVDGTQLQNQNVELGAFCGAECRGAVLPSEAGGDYLYVLTVGGDNNGDEITFRLWNHETNSELDYSCSTTVSYAIDGWLGVPPDPYFEISFSSCAFSLNALLSSSRFFT